MDHIDLNILNTLPTKRVLTLDVARFLADAALKAAAEKNINYLVVSIVDDGGYLITLSRQSGAELAAVEIGIAKARTAAITRKPTQWWTDQLHNGVYAFLAMPGVTPVGGAHPIKIDGQVVGAISTAGGSFEVDNDICQTALAVLGNG
jgi:glc operon protein GlcG